ncbi:MAG: serine/threonine protein kinase [Vulcanimicrobiota bacterium]
MPTLEIGTILQNRYRVSRVLFQSKLTNVYAVDDIHMVGNIWALKEMKFLAMNEYERQNMLSQFKKEFLRLCSLSHPHLARFIDYFVEGKNLYILREFIPAYALRDLMRRPGGLRERDVIYWATQLADVLHYLYKKKFSAVFFRELSLLNILLDNEGNVKIVDLGLATIFQTETNPDRLRNIGCMDYASPELFDEAGEFDEKSLVYSLGAIIFHMLTCQNPAQNLFNLPPVEEFNPEVSQATRKIIKKATSNDPEKRFRSLKEMKKSLEYFLKNQSFVIPEEDTAKNNEKKNTKKPTVIKETEEGEKVSFFLIFVILMLLGTILFVLYKYFL